MGTSTYAVTWRAQDDVPSVGELQIDGTRVTLAGRAYPCAFEARELERIVVTPDPSVHLRVRDHGWLVVNTAAAGAAFEIVGELSRLQTL